MTLIPIEPEDSLEELYEHAPCGLLSLLPDGTIVKVNDTMLSWMGRDRASLLGVPFLSLLSPGGRIFYETRFVQALWLRRELREIAMTIVRADGSDLPALVNATLVSEHNGDPRLVRLAIFDATERQDYERDLVAARQNAEWSESRVRVLQEASSAFALSATEGELAEALVASARDAFDASAVAVMLVNRDGTSYLAAGQNPLADFAASAVGSAQAESMRRAGNFTVSRTEEVRETYAELADAMVAAELEAFSVVVLEQAGYPVGALICFFEGQRSFGEHDIALQIALARQSATVLARIRLQDELERLALHDQLTGLANRKLLREQLAAAIGSVPGNEHPMALVFVDLDGFKAVNDELGHSAGDSVLTWVAARLEAAVRSTDVVGRFGGDEFVVICENAGEAEATIIAERIRSLINENSPDLPEGVRVRASIGVALHQPAPGLGTAPETIFVAADAAMYRSKELGGDRVTIVDV